MQSSACHQNMYLLECAKAASNSGIQPSMYSYDSTKERRKPKRAKDSAAGNGAWVFRMTVGNTDRYTTADLTQIKSCYLNTKNYDCIFD